MAYGKSGKKADIQTKIIKVFEDQSVEYSRGGGSELRVIAWIVDGSEKSPQLERRDWWNDAEGEKKPGKAKGFTVSDFTFMLEHAKEIGEYMGVPAKLIETSLMQNQTSSPAPVAVGASDPKAGGMDEW